MNHQPEWLNRKVTSMKRSGKLLLIRESQFDIMALSSKTFTPYIKLLKYLDISGTIVNSLEGLPVLPHIQTFIANGTQIGNLTNFNSLSNANKISLKKTPVSQLKNYKLSIILVCGTKISTIDEQVIPKVLKTRSESYPEYAKELINRGWIAEYPCPTQERWLELCDRYNYQITIKQETSTNLQEDLDEENEDDSYVSEFEHIRQEYHDKFDAIHRKAAELFDIQVESNIEAELAEKIGILFTQHGLALEAVDDDAIVQAVEQLCIQATTNLETPSSLSEESD